jgi:multidrug transporter EmrE-like cation transporter
MMPIKTLLLILVSVVFSVTGQLLLKAGAQSVAPGRGEFLVAALKDPRVLGGLLAWTASTVCWLYVLRVAPLSRAYGLTSLTYVLLFGASVYVFAEPVRRVHVVGTLLIVVGIACLMYGD